MAESSPSVVWADEESQDRIHVATGTRWIVETVGGRLQWTLDVNGMLATYARALTGTLWVWRLERGAELVSSGRCASEQEAIEALLAASRA